MPTAPRPGYAPVGFDERRWDQDLQRCTPEARTAARAWRTAVERDGLLVASLLACRDDARDATSLAACAKTYVPAPAGPWGAVLALELPAGEQRAALLVIAFGLRHPPPSSRRASVYELAHRRLHGD